ncbi:endopeptidase La [Ileibacterium valens]|uniref:Lon protease n=1 Tax=Ileibacterium valens TaxID=1862668 RepID=A0A1U7NDF8_9FIRM|nr:endopeptidase La [Ileibacterium valens]OLU37039.1 endopeptidase La [Ileibacterium valens]OLU41644.1 endopeptidase La [Erysipelotrichaceae bacterium NYU-BL-E8]OLU42727.1 endopeptidase La [Erysipelotrichaceae bacterium NYU-BL-F16]
MENNKELYSAAVLPVIGTLLLPDINLQLSNLDRMSAVRLQQTRFIAVPVKNENQNSSIWEADDLYKYGVECVITSVSDGKDGILLNVRTGARVHVIEMGNGILPECRYEIAEEERDIDQAGEKEMLAYIKRSVHQISTSFKGMRPVLTRLESIKDINSLISFLSQYMNLSATEKYELLKTDSLRERALMFMDLVILQKEKIALTLEMNEKISEQNNKWYRKQALKAQLEAIKKELAKTEGNSDDDQDEEELSYREQIEMSAMPEQVKKAILREAKKLEDSSSQGSVDQDVMRNYIEFALEMPWKKEELQPCDLKKAREILEADHYGMEKVKERIIQHLAVMALKRSNKGSALLLVGPPGTGKTSLGKSIAKALGREYTRLSLGGVRDESEIRGHRRTYVGAMAGRILQTIKQAGKTNPVMILDEIDKLMQGGFAGDPAAAMLEVLDPEQNNSFTDHYLDQPYDLSDVFFIATANSLDTIPAPLLDRMEVIEISSYTASEKFHIAKDHLIPLTLDEFGIRDDQLQISDEAITTIVEEYTMEAGCRGLKKRIAQIARSKSEELLDENTVLPIIIESKDLEEILGAQKRHHQKVKDENPAGVVTGLAWTPVGGEVLFIETMSMPGNGATLITGQLGEVMQESAKIALSLLKSRLPIDFLPFKERDIHIHVPAGATPKDGPSAGITLFSALASLAMNKPIDSHIAMTGELTLRGDVEPIGGLKEKLFGAMRAGITKVLIPETNKADLKEVSEEVLDALEIIPVRTVEDVLRETLGITLPPIEMKMDPSIRFMI